MGKNIFITALQNREKQINEMTNQNEWGIRQRDKLVKVLEEAGAKITDHVYDLLLFNINGLRINEKGQVCYLSFYKESKKVTELLKRYSQVIKDNFNYITSQN